MAFAWATTHCVEGVRAASNGGNGILTGPASLVRGNTAEDNGGFGLSLDAETGYVQNVLSNNNGGSGNPQVNGGVEMGTNICGGAALAREASRLRRCMVMRMIRIGRSE